MDRTRLYRITEAIGRWSMVDIFVVTILVALVRLGNLATVEAQLGAVFFGAVVVLTMLGRRVVRPAPDLGQQRSEAGMSSDRPDDLDVAEAVVSARRRPSIVWLIPIVAAIVGAFVAWRTYSELGPEIRISFESAEGLEAGKTPIKYKDVEVGKVEEVRLRKNLAGRDLHGAHGQELRAPPGEGHALLGGARAGRGRRRSRSSARSSPAPTSASIRRERARRSASSAASRRRRS